MSWAADEWKDGLPNLALQKITQLETQLAKFKKDRDQKQCQLESLEVALQSQKKKTEEEKSSAAQLARECKRLSETCEDMQKKTAKMQQDIHSKENRILSLEGTVARNKHTMENGENAKAQTQLRSQLDALEAENKLLHKEKKALEERLITQKENAAGENNTNVGAQNVGDGNAVRQSEGQQWSSTGRKGEAPAKLLQQISQLEQQMDKLKKEKDQKHCQLDSLDQALQTQKRKTDEAKAEATNYQRELVSMCEACENLEQARGKLQTELTAKESQASYLSAQLTTTKAALEKELSKSQSEQKRMQSEMIKLEKQVKSLEQSRIELNDKKIAMDRALQSNDSKMANLKNKLEKEESHKSNVGKKLEEKMAEVHKLKEQMKALNERSKHEAEQNDKLRATIQDKDMTLEAARDRADKLKIQLIEKEEQVSSLTVVVLGLRTEVEEVKRSWGSRQKALQEDKEQATSIMQEELDTKQEKITSFAENSEKLIMELNKVRHCYTEQTVQLERVKQSKAVLEEEKAAVEASCRRLEEQLDCAAQQGRDRDQVHGNQISNFQATKRELEAALDGLQHKYDSVCQDQEITCSALKEVQEKWRLAQNDLAHLQERLHLSQSKLDRSYDISRLQLAFFLFSLAVGLLVYVFTLPPY